MNTNYINLYIIIKKMLKSDINKRLYFKRFKIKKLIFNSEFSELYEGININNNESVAMKFEKRKREYNLLESEAHCLINWKGPGIPKLVTYGNTDFYIILIEELLGPNLNSLLEPTKKKNEK